MPLKARSASRIWSMCFLKHFGNIWWIIFITMNNSSIVFDFKAGLLCTFKAEDVLVRAFPGTKERDTWGAQVWYSVMLRAHAGVTWSPHRPIKFGLFLSRAFICWPQEKKDGLAKIEEYFCQSTDDPLVLLRTHPSYPLNFLRHASSPYIGRTYVYSTSKKLDQTSVFQHYYSFAQLNTPRTITSSDGIIKAYGLSL